MTLHEINMKHEHYDTSIFIPFVSLSVKKRLTQVVKIFLKMYNKGKFHHINSTIKFTY